MDPALLAAVALVVIIAAISWANHSGTERSRRERLANIHTIPLEPETTAWVRRELSERRKIQAVSVLRDRTGIDLAVAKALAEAIEAGHTPPEPPSGSATSSARHPADRPSAAPSTAAHHASFAERARELRAQGREMDAIRLLCDEAGMTIDEAQKFIAALR